MSEALDLSIAHHCASALAFLEALVRCSSTLGHEQSALDRFAAEIEDVGLGVRRLPFPSGPIEHPDAAIAPAPTRVTPDRFQVLATSGGDGPLHLLLNGHMDVVPAANSAAWHTPPFDPSQREGRLFGRGAADMKCGFAIGILALRALRDVKPDLFAHRRIGFLAAIEEECGGNGSLFAGYQHDVVAREVVVLEPTDLNLLIGGVGVLWLEATITTLAGHAAEADSRANAVDVGMHLFDVFKQWAAETTEQHRLKTSAEWAPQYSVNLGKVEAGDWTSSVPSRGVFSFRVAFPRGWTSQEGESRLRKVAANAMLDASLTLRATGFRASGYIIAENDPLVRDLAAAHHAAHGTQPRRVSVASSTDARTYINTFGVPAVCYGASGHDLHGIDESVDIASIAAAARTLARFILMRFDPTQDSA